MGYESARFFGEIDNEFYCAICTMVLENPVISPCDHIFCNECIQHWLVLISSCPVDRKPLQLVDLKDPPRYFCNMLNKLEITCNFEQKGCTAVVKLEHLSNHIATCEHNPNAEIICDKGCNLKLKRHEYQVNNCSSHLGSLLRCKEKEILELRQELSRSRDLLAKICYKFKEFEIPPKWQVIHNIKIDDDQPNILEFNGSADGMVGMAQSLYSLKPDKHSFKIEVFGLVNVKIGIGITRRAHPSNVFPGKNIGSIGCCSTGQSWVDGECKPVGRQWKLGDIIEFKMKFPSDFTNDGTKSTQVIYTVNEKECGNTTGKMPIDGFFPTIFISGTSPTKVKYQDLNFS